MSFFAEPYWSSYPTFYINQHYSIHVFTYNTTYFLRYPIVMIVGAWFDRVFISHLVISATEGSLFHELLLLWQISSLYHSMKRMEAGCTSAFSSWKTNFLCCLAFSKSQQQSRNTNRLGCIICNKEEQREQEDLKTWKGSVKLIPSWGLQSTKQDLLQNSTTFLHWSNPSVILR